MSHSCSQIFNNSNGTIPPGGSTGTGNPFAILSAVVLNYDSENNTIDSTGSIGFEVRVVIKRLGVVIETTLAETNYGNNQIPYTSSLQNGDQIYVQSSNDGFVILDEDSIFLPSPAFSFMDSCPIILIDQILVNGEVSINIDGATTQLTATISPTDAAIQHLIWTSSDPAIATVNQQGLVTPHNNGNVTIYASSNDGGGAVGEHILALSNQTPNNLLISDIAPNGGVLIQYDELIGLEENQIEFFRDGMVEGSGNYDLNPATGTITLLVAGDVFEGEAIEIRLL